MRYASAYCVLSIPSRGQYDPRRCLYTGWMVSNISMVLYAELQNVYLTPDWIIRFVLASQLLLINANLTLHRYCFVSLSNSSRSSLVLALPVRPHLQPFLFTLHLIVSLSLCNVLAVMIRLKELTISRFIPHMLVLSMIQSLFLSLS